MIRKSFGNKGEEIVRMNNAAVDAGGEVTKVAVPAEWKKLNGDDQHVEQDVPDFIKNIVVPVNHLKGDDLPVSAFLGREDGTFMAGTTEYEKRGIAVNVPEWQVEHCIQCNQCAYVCPHACIRPFLFTEEELKNAPDGTSVQETKGKFAGYKFRIQVSVLDCTGCGNCADNCPSKEKSLIMKPLETQLEEVGRWDYISKNITYKDTVVPKDQSVKNSQFAQPLFEFSGACAGCGETPYIKVITQLYGERMIVANATGCSSIYGGSAPATPYRPHNVSGHGPAWANSLFEDNAEYGYGVAIGTRKMRDRIALKIKEALKDGGDEGLKTAYQEWIDTMDDAEGSQEAANKLIPLLEQSGDQLAKDILSLKQYLVKKSIWIVGGDGWAYDIGYGGLDHVLASGEDLNVLVLDTEVYSNTGGQASKSTPAGAVAKFAASGKKIRKKDLGLMAMSYGYVYVAQVAMGASQNQYFKALKEAESYPGPSLLIAYSPCINHGIKLGMGKTQYEQELAVNAGYWQLYRYNPLLELEGKNPFQLDSKEPDWNQFQGFLNGEVRYASLKKAFPGEAARLDALAEQNAKWRYETYRRMAAMEYPSK
jgi:pyruvate-ferredoxin/flavodoxin oxidoreductase